MPSGKLVFQQSFFDLIAAAPRAAHAGKSTSHRLGDRLWSFLSIVVIITVSTTKSTAITPTDKIRGDVFVGRAHDDERIDWERLDFTVADADPKAPWCRQARSPGEGGGQGGRFPTVASSLTTLLQQQMNVADNQAPMIMGEGGASGTSSGNNHQGSMFGMDGAPAVIEEWGSWTQTQDEIELKVPLTEGDSVVKAKDCQVLFRRQSLKVLVGNVVKVEGTLFGSIVPDDCTYTIESGGGGRELCITLTKAEEGMTWSWVTIT